MAPRTGVNLRTGGEHLDDKNYWYVNDNFRFYRFPEILANKEIYPDLTSDAMVLYGMIMSRMSMSYSLSRESFTDKNGEIFCYFTIKDVCSKLKCGKEKAIKTMKLLADENLIRKEKQGQGRPTRIYLLKPRGLISVPRCTKTGLQEGGETENQEVGESEPNYRDNTNRDGINRDISILDYDSVLEEIKTRTEYDFLLSKENTDNKILEELVKLMADIMCSTTDTITVNGQTVARETVCNRLKEIGADHLEYVMNCIKAGNSRVRNIRAYMLTALYNAPVTIDTYYQTEVNYDLRGS